MERRNAEQRVEAVGRGDHRAFADLNREHIDAVVAFAVRRCRDPHEVAGCRSDVRAVWERPLRPDQGTPPAWIVDIASGGSPTFGADARRLRLSHRLTAEALLSGDDIERITSTSTPNGRRKRRSPRSATCHRPSASLPKVAVEGARPMSATSWASTRRVRMRLTSTAGPTDDGVPDARTTRSTT